MNIYLGTFSILVLVTVGCYWGITAYWYWLIDKDNQLMFGVVMSAVSSIIGALFGSLSGGFYSYLGSLNAARWEVDIKKKQGKKKIILQLIYSLDVINKTVDKGKTQGFMPNGLFILDNWIDYLIDANFKKEEELQIISFLQKWKGIPEIKQVYGEHGQIKLESMKAIMQGKNKDEIEKIVKEYDK